MIQFLNYLEFKFQMKLPNIHIPQNNFKAVFKKALLYWKSWNSER